MPKVSSSIVVDRPREAVFCLTQDYHLRREWDPFVRDMRFLDGATRAALGVRVWVRAWNGLAMEVEYVSYRPHRVAAIKMTDGPSLFSTFGGVWRFSDDARGGTEVVFEYGYRTRWSALRPALDRAVGWAFGRDVRARLAAVKRAAEGTDILDRLGADCA